MTNLLSIITFLPIVAAGIMAVFLRGDDEAAQQPGLYRFLLNKWYFDEIYHFVFVRPALWIGRKLWTAGDVAVIDGAINGLALGIIPRLTRFAGRVQSGYVFHYAFAMVVGIVGLLIWVMMRGAH